jgi:putative ABC transport system permease protein
VLNEELAQRLFGSATAIGQRVQLGTQSYMVIGVLTSWHPKPLFYGSSKGDFAFKSEDGFFAPLSTAIQVEAGISASMTCWESGSSGYTGDGCAWLQYWVRLKDAGQRQKFADYLTSYWQEQRKSGRAMGGGPPELLPLGSRLDQLKLIPPDLSLQVWLTLALLGICVLNAISLLMAKTLRRSTEISIRRAIGATRLDIASQIGMEAVGIGAASGLVGIVASKLLILGIRERHTEYASLVHLDSFLLFLTVALAVACVLVASILPAWQAASVKPSDNLKAQ